MKKSCYLIGIRLGKTAGQGEAIFCSSRAKYLLVKDGISVWDAKIITSIRAKDFEIFELTQPCTLQLYGNHISGPCSLAGEIIMEEI